MPWALTKGKLPFASANLPFGPGKLVKQTACCAMPFLALHLHALHSYVDA